MNTGLERREIITSKELSPEQFFGYKEELNVLLENTLLILQWSQDVSEWDQLDSSDLATISSVIVDFLQLLSIVYAQNNIVLDTDLLAEDLLRRGSLQHSTDIQEIWYALQELIQHWWYLDMLHRYTTTHWSISIDQERIKSFLTTLNTGLDVIRPQRWLADLETDILYSQFETVDDVHIFLWLLDTKYDHRIISIIDRMFVQKKDISSSEKKYMDTYLHYWLGEHGMQDFLDNIEQQEQLRDEEVATDLEQENHWSYLWLRFRLGKYGYILDNTHSSGWVKVRMWWTLLAWVSKESKKWKALIRKWLDSDAKILKKILPLVQDELRMMTSHINHSIPKRKEDALLLKHLEDLTWSIQKGKMRAAKRSYSKYIRWLDRLKIKPNFKSMGKWVVGLSGGRYVSKVYLRQNQAIEKWKQWIAIIQNKIEKLQKTHKNKLQRLDILWKHSPTQVSTYRKQAISANKAHNKAVTLLQTEGVKILNDLDDMSIKLLAKTSPFVQQYLSWNQKRSNVWQTIESKKRPSLTSDKKKSIISRKWLVWWGMFSLMMWWVGESVDDGISKDLWDAGVWLIPIIWWFHDLRIFFKDEDLNRRKLTLKQSMERLWFGIVWLVPGLGLVVKITKWAKTWKNAIKMMRLYSKISRTSMKAASTYSLWSLWLYGVYGIWEMISVPVRGALRFVDEIQASPFPDFDPNDAEQIQESPEQKLLNTLTDEILAMRESKQTVIKKLTWLQSIFVDHLDLIRSYGLDVQSVCKDIFETQTKEILTQYIYEDGDISDMGSIPTLSYTEDQQIDVPNLVQQIQQQHNISQVRVVDMSWINQSLQATEFDQTHDLSTQWLIKTLVSPPVLLTEATSLVQLPLKQVDSALSSYLQRNTEFFGSHRWPMDSSIGQWLVINEPVTGVLIWWYQLVEYEWWSYLDITVMDESTPIHIMIPAILVVDDLWFIGLRNDDYLHHLIATQLAVYENDIKKV